MEQTPNPQLTCPVCLGHKFCCNVCDADLTDHVGALIPPAPHVAVESPQETAGSLAVACNEQTRLPGGHKQATDALDLAHAKGCADGMEISPDINREGVIGVLREVQALADALLPPDHAGRQRPRRRLPKVPEASCL